MPAPRVNGFTVAYAAVGGVVLWSGIKGTTLSTMFQDLLKGQAPTQDQQQVGVPALSISTPAGSSASASAAPGNTGASTATAAANQSIARVLAAPYGWSTGTEWSDLVSLWNRESSWSNTATNSSSGAYGIPQALPASKMPAAAQAPPVGTSSASAQISWGLSYIKSAYGSPSAAWAHEESAGWY